MENVRGGRCRLFHLYNAGSYGTPVRAISSRVFWRWSETVRNSKTFKREDIYCGAHETGPMYPEPSRTSPIERTYYWSWQRNCDARSSASWSKQKQNRVKENEVAANVVTTFNQNFTTRGASCLWIILRTFVIYRRHALSKPPRDDNCAWRSTCALTLWSKMFVCRPGQRMASTTPAGRFRTSHWLITAANRSGVQREVWNLPPSVTFFVAVAHVKTTAVFSFCLSSEPLGFGRPVDSKVELALYMSHGCN